MLHEWLFQNVQNQAGNIITIPDTGSVGGLNISNPALTNKPTASTIGGKISYKGDAVDDYLYLANTDFLRGYATWVIHTAFTFDNSAANGIISCFNESNINLEGWRINVGTNGILQVLSWNSSGVLQTTSSAIGVITNGNSYVFTALYDGTNTKILLNGVEVASAATVNPITRSATTTNISLYSIIRTSGNIYYKPNIGYIGIKEYNAGTIGNNITTIKNFFGI